VDVSWPLVGRQAELEALVADIREARGGVVLAGAAGVGKTRLAKEALAGVHAVGRDVVGGRDPGGCLHPVRRGFPPAASGRAPRR
jgi:hypothetical protein